MFPVTDFFLFSRSLPVSFARPHIRSGWTPAGSAPGGAAEPRDPRFDPGQWGLP